MKTNAAFCGLFLLCFLAVCAGDPGGEAFRRPCIEVPFAKKAPLLDGAENDPTWSNGADIPNLTLSLGMKEKVPLQKTRVRLLWDKQFLYVRFICEDDDILATLKGRDAEYHREDAVEVFIDPAGDEKQYIELQVSPNNGVRDVLYLCTGEPKSDEYRIQTAELVERDIWVLVDWTFDGLKTASSRFDSAGRHGWIAELAIPASCLRRLGQKEFQPMTLRANFIRLDRPKNPARPGERFFVSSNWSSIFSGRAHRSPTANGYLKLVDP